MNLDRLKPHQEVWYLKLNDPLKNKALWLRFTLLVSRNGFKQIAETWAVFFRREGESEVNKVALKQTFPLRQFGQIKDDGIKIGESILTSKFTRGKVQSKGQSIQWDLRFVDQGKPPFNLVPSSLRRSGLVKNTAVTGFEDLRFTGTVEINGEPQEWIHSPGMQAHLSGTKNGHSWVWGHSNAFVNAQNRPVDFIFEGLTARAKILGSVPSPRLSSFYFFYQGKAYLFNSLWKAIQARSRFTPTEWHFQADDGDLSFRGQMKSKNKDFAGLTYEDTDGSFLYCANSKLSDLMIHVYRRGKLEDSFHANGTAAFEVVTRQKNPYVPLLI